VRYAGTAKDADVWIARHADGGNCLVVDAKGDPTLWTIGCSGPLSPFVGTYLRDVGDFEYYPQGIPGGEPEEGWSAIGKWRGVPLRTILEGARLRDSARYLVFRCADDMGGGRPYYESIDLIDAFHPQTILAFALNDAPLTVANGAPVRLRVERQLG